MQHVEQHFESSEVIRDIVIGMADGLTVPFALAAGLSGAVSTTVLIITAGLAEIAAGSIAMGLGGYLAARTDREHYSAEEARERREIVELPERERKEVEDIVSTWGIEGEAMDKAVTAITQDHEKWLNFMMKYELGLEVPDPKRARNSSMTIGISYIVGGLIPLSPYFFISTPSHALWVSVLATLVALFIFGWIKGTFTGAKPAKSALQMMLVGGLAAFVAYVVAKLIS